MEQEKQDQSRIQIAVSGYSGTDLKLYVSLFPVIRYNYFSQEEKHSGFN